jgi:hypothetical protein
MAFVVTHGSKSDAERTTGALPFHTYAPILNPRQLHNTNQRQFRFRS